MTVRAALLAADDRLGQGRPRPQLQAGQLQFGQLEARHVAFALRRVAADRGYQQGSALPPRRELHSFLGPAAAPQAHVASGLPTGAGSKGGLRRLVAVRAALTLVGLRNQRLV